MNRLRTLAQRLRNEPVALGAIAAVVALFLGDNAPGVQQVYTTVSEGAADLTGVDAPWADYLTLVLAAFGARRKSYGPVTVNANYTTATAEHLQRELAADDHQA